MRLVSISRTLFISPMMPFFLPYFRQRRLSFTWMIPVTLVSAIAFVTPLRSATAQTPTTGNTGQTAGNRSLFINATRQEADSKTGVFTAIGNVQINYPSRQIQATAAQAQYFSRERKIVLSGNVYVLQQGNSIRGDSITYLIDQGRFIATPKSNSQVESIYIINDSNPQAQTQAAPQTPPLTPKPAPTRTPVPQTPAFTPKPASPTPTNAPTAPKQ